MSDVQPTRIEAYMNFLDLHPEAQMKIHRNEVSKQTRSPRHCGSSVDSRNDGPIVGERFTVLVDGREVYGK